MKNGSHFLKIWKILNIWKRQQQTKITLTKKLITDYIRRTLTTIRPTPQPNYLLIFRVFFLIYVSVTITSSVFRMGVKLDSLP
jgi:hypothetical protein